MKNISEYLFENIITEGVYKDIPGNVEECKIYFKNKLIKGNNIPDEFIELMFSIWEDNFDSAPSKIPFRCDGRHAKISRIYMSFIGDIEQLCDRVSVGFESKPLSHIKINGVKFEWGEGSIRGNRAEKGLSYEDDVVKELINIVELVAGSPKKLNEKEFKEIVNNPVLAEWWQFYNAGALDEVISEYPCDLSKIIIKNGGGNTARNSRDELFNDKFEITNKNINQVLKDSGKIIADVTIDTKNPVYISVKMKASQLSGVSYKNAINKNETFKNAVLESDTWDNIKDSPDMIPFNNFFNVLGILPEDVFNKYKSIYSGKSTDMNLQLSDKYDPQVLGCLFQKLLGGNYWYVKPGIHSYVNDKDAKLKFNIKSARVSESGKTITVSGDVNGLKSEINFRTDSEKYGPWPYRLFPKINVFDLIDQIS